MEKLSKQQMIKILRVLGEGNFFKIWRKLKGKNAISLCNLFWATPSIKIHFSSWDKFSGEVYFPVSKSGEASSYSFFEAKNSYFKIWAFYGYHEYGRNRCELAGHIADCMEKEL